MLFVSIHSLFQIYSLFVHYLVFVFPIRKCEEFDLEGLDTTWNDSQAVPVSDEEGDTIPQFDGANDEKPQPGTSSTDSCTEHINLLLSISYCNLVNLNARSKICKKITRCKSHSHFLTLLKYFKIQQKWFYILQIHTKWGNHRIKYVYNKEYWVF